MDATATVMVTGRNDIWWNTKKSFLQLANKTLSHSHMTEEREDEVKCRGGEEETKAATYTAMVASISRLCWRRRTWLTLWHRFLCSSMKANMRLRKYKSTSTTTQICHFLPLSLTLAMITWPVMVILGYKMNVTVAVIFTVVWLLPYLSVAVSTSDVHTISLAECHVNNSK